MAKFSVEYSISGTMTEIIEADSKVEAENIATSKAYSDDWEPDLDSIDDANVYVQEMHRVLRDGKAVWTTRVLSTDELSPLD